MPLLLLAARAFHSPVIASPICLSTVCKMVEGHRLGLADISHPLPAAEPEIYPWRRQEIIHRTKDACGIATSMAARRFASPPLLAGCAWDLLRCDPPSPCCRAVLLLTRKDLLAKGLEGVSVMLDDIQLTNAAAVAKVHFDFPLFPPFLCLPLSPTLSSTLHVPQMLLEQYNDLCNGWRQLLEEHEREAQRKLDAKSEECEVSQRALADLLKASQRLKEDSIILVEENRVSRA